MPVSWEQLGTLLSTLHGQTLTDVERALGLYVAGLQETKKRKRAVDQKGATDSNDDDTNYSLYPRRHRQRVRIVEATWHAQAVSQKRMGISPGPKAMMVSDLMMTQYGDVLLDKLKQVGGILNVFSGRLGVARPDLMICQAPEIITSVYNAIVDCAARFGNGSTVRAYAKKLSESDPRKERARLIEKVFFSMETNAHTLWHIVTGDIHQAATLPWTGFDTSVRISCTIECQQKLLQLIEAHGREVTSANLQRMNREVQYNVDMQTSRMGNMEQYCQNARSFVEQLWHNKPSKFHDNVSTSSDWIAQRGAIPRKQGWRLCDESSKPDDILGVDALKNLMQFAAAITAGVNANIQWRRKDIDAHHHRYFSTRTLTDIYPMWAWQQRERGPVNAVMDAPLTAHRNVVYPISSCYDHIPEAFLKCVMSVSGCEGTSAEREPPPESEIGAHGARKTLDSNTAMRNTRRQWIRTFTEISLPEAVGGLELQRLLLEEIQKDPTFDGKRPEVFYQNTSAATIKLFHIYYNVVLQQVMAGAVGMMMVRLAFAVGSNRKSNPPDLLLVPIIWHLYFMIGAMYHCEQFMLRTLP